VLANMSGQSLDQSMLQAQAMIFQKFSKLADRCFRDVIKAPGAALSEKEQSALDACVDQQMALEEYLVQRLQDQAAFEASKGGD